MPDVTSTAVPASFIKSICSRAWRVATAPGLPTNSHYVLAGARDQQHRIYTGASSFSERGRGWVGRRLDDGVDWSEVEAVGEDAYRAVAPKRLVVPLEVTPAPDIGRVQGC